MLQVEQIAAQIREADYFLIGIGEAFAVGTKAEQSPLGKAYMENKKRLEGEAALLPAEREYVEILDMVGSHPAKETEEKRARVQQAYAILSKIVEKKELHLPAQVKNVISCKNPRCITSIEQELDQIFILTDKENEVYRCKYCEEKFINPNKR